MATTLLFIAGLILLLAGAHFLVSSSSALAARIGIPPIIIGVTVVAFATSAPEIAVSLQAVFNGQADLALGNVIGSNIVNILFILGISAVIAPVKITRRIVRMDIPIMIGATAIVYLLAYDMVISLAEGIVLLILFSAFLVFQINQSRKTRYSSTGNKDREVPSRNLVTYIVIVIAGLVFLVLGAQLMVNSSIKIARYFGLSELIMGLTIIALGTSLPEVATSVIAALKNEADISVGNVIGSNIFNMLLVLGLAAVVAENGISLSRAAIALDLPFLVAVSVACLPIFFTGHKIARWEGFLFLSYYAAYILYLFLNATQHKFLSLFSNVMILFIVPITAVTLVIFVFRYYNATDKQ